MIEKVGEFTILPKHIHDILCLSSDTLLISTIDDSDTVTLYFYDKRKDMCKTVKEMMGLPKFSRPGYYLGSSIGILVTKNVALSYYIMNPITFDLKEVVVETDQLKQLAIENKLNSILTHICYPWLIVITPALWSSCVFYSLNLETQEYKIRRIPEQFPNRTFFVEGQKQDYVLLMTYKDNKSMILELYDRKLDLVGKWNYDGPSLINFDHWVYSEKEDVLIGSVTQLDALTTIFDGYYIWMFKDERLYIVDIKEVGKIAKTFPTVKLNDMVVFDNVLFLSLISEFHHHYQAILILYDLKSHQVIDILESRKMCQIPENDIMKEAHYRLFLTGSEFNSTYYNTLFAVNECDGTVYQWKEVHR